MKRSPLRLLGPLLALSIFVGAVVLISTQLTSDDVSKVGDRLHEIVTTSPWTIVLAIGLTVVNYLILVGYDLLAVRYVGESLSIRRVALASFTAYACGYNFGSTLAGSSVRYRLYSAWGVPTIKIVQLLIILALTFWFGLFALAGVVFIIAPLKMPPLRYLPFNDTVPLGVILLSIAVVYIALSAMHCGSIRLFRWRLPVPPFKLTVYQVLIASADLMLVAGVLYVLWPSSQSTSYLQVLGIYMLVFVVGVLTHVPGGYGVMEVVLLAVIPDVGSRSDIIASWLLFRVVYYLIPLMVAAVMLGWHELVLTHLHHAEQPAKPLPEPSGNGHGAASDDKSAEVCGPRPVVGSDRQLTAGFCFGLLFHGPSRPMRPLKLSMHGQRDYRAWARRQRASGRPSASASARGPASVQTQRRQRLAQLQKQRTTSCSRCVPEPSPASSEPPTSDPTAMAAALTKL